MKKYLLIDSLGGGGAEVLNIELFKSSNFEAIFTLTDLNAYSTESVNIIKLSKNENENSRFKYLKIPLQSLKLSQKINQGDLLLVSLYKSMLVAIFCNLFFKKIKIVIWVHNDSKLYMINKLSFKLIKWIYAHVDFIVVNSRKAKLDLVNFFYIKPDKIESIYNFFDIQAILESEIQPIPKDFFSATIKNSSKIISVGRLNLKKGQINLIRVIAELIKRGQNVHLILLGDGDYQNVLEREVEFLNIKNYVSFIGFKTNIYTYIRQCDLFAFASHTEGFGNVIIEALSVGIPVISSDIDSGPREILAPNTPINLRTDVPDYAEYGILMPSFSSIQPDPQIEMIWADTIQEILSNKEIYKKYKNIGRSIVNHFDKKEIVPIWDNLLDTINNT